MPSVDATQHLLTLRDEINEAWFRAACDLALISSGSAITEASLADLYELFYGTKQYSPIVSQEAQASSDAQSIPNFLQSIDQFSGFKKLHGGLQIAFDKRITLIFGKNGSGKSSVCDAVKVLASPSGTGGELRNVYKESNSQPQFNYKFLSESQPRTWSPSVGFGVANSAIKYFDSTIAIRNITEEAKPSDAVEVSLFRLEVFDYVREITKRFNHYLNQQLQAQEAVINHQIEAAKSFLTPNVDINSEPFLSWNTHQYRDVLKLVNTLPLFDEESQRHLDQKISELAMIDTSLSHGGVQALLGQQTILGQVHSQLQSLCGELAKIDPERIRQIIELIGQKESALVELGDFPEPVVALITGASQLKDFGEIKVGDDSCPLCEEPITINSQALFKRYHSYLTSKLQAELTQFRQELSVFESAIQVARQVILTDLTSCEELLPTGFKSSLETSHVHLQQMLEEFHQRDFLNSRQFIELRSQLNQSNVQIASFKMSIDNSISLAQTNRGGLEESRKNVASEIAQMLANQTVHNNRTELTRVCRLCEEYSPKRSRVVYYDFSLLLRKLSTTGKAAYNDLVMTNFESKLSDEYRRLTGATHEDFGISLRTRSSNQVVYATPQIGQSEVTRVLSEGEQKVHSLAVFFCEASINTQQVLVFDDPVTSFDYNHISNFCERLRDFATDNPDTQIIILTHNWDFFASFQLVLKRRGNLHNELSVQVLENCATIEEYVEKWDSLCAEIENILQMPEPVGDLYKEQLSARLRRLMERLVNGYVFNEQRHQYKVKSLKVTEFSSFTNIVPLTVEEAGQLRDLYANLSPSEHDDIRNQYTTRRLHEFRHWYQEICELKDAILQRRSN